MDRTSLRKELIRDEGCVSHAYQDSEGYWTIGIGHLIDKKRGGKLSEKAIELIFNEDVDEKIAQLESVLPWFGKLTDARQRVLVNMCFNLGLSGLMGFKNTLKCIEEGRYSQAAENMLMSKWAKQVGMRAIRLAKMMEDGE